MANIPQVPCSSVSSTLGTTKRQPCTTTSHSRSIYDNTSVGAPREIGFGAVYIEQMKKKLRNEIKRCNTLPNPKLRARLLEQIVRYAPCVSALVRKQLRTRHVEDLPAVVPRCCVFLAVRLDEVRPDFFLAGRHLGQPVLLQESQSTHIEMQGGKRELTSQVLE